MSKNAVIARELFKQGFNCSQSTLGAFSSETGISRSALLKAASGFGGGIAGRKETCGAVTGMLMAAGLIFGNDEALSPEEKTAMTAKMRRLIEKFEQGKGCVSCKDLLRIMPSDQPQREYCGELVYFAAEIIADEVGCCGK